MGKEEALGALRVLVGFLLSLPLARGDKLCLGR